MTSAESLAFNPEALWVARSFRGLNVTELADKAGVSRQIISAIENGGTQPFRPSLLAIAAALDFPIEFFQTKLAVPKPDIFHFRAGARVPQYALDRSRAQAALFTAIAGSFKTFARVAAPRLPTLKVRDAESIEAAAETFRSAIKVRADAPIGNAVRAAEAAGVFVGTFEPSDMPVHGFATYGEVPLLFLSEASSWSRRRFSAMHEVGHLIFHRHGAPAEKEEQANRFAGAVLAPRRAFWREFPRPTDRRFDWPALIGMKKRWGMSLQAIIYRANDLRLIDAAQFRTANIHIANEGWKTKEPGEQSPEQPAICSAFIAELERRRSITSLCEQTRLHSELVAQTLGVPVVSSEPEQSSVLPIGKRKRG